ncbi:MAG: thioredoxin domain-containing protein [Candidatus Pacebacteria bacterium]|nr:thioredoxin domain-containing protein [Candidatus Paceibacterota bacterium]
MPTKKKTPDQPAKTSKLSLDAFLTFVQNNFVILFVLILIFIGGFFFGSLWTENKVAKSGRIGTIAAPTAPTAPQAAPGGPTADQLKSVGDITDADHVIGNPKKAKVTLFEYSDLNCHFCQQFHVTMQAVVQKYGDDVAWVYRHHPILGSQTEAEAAECAAKLGGEQAFWGFVDTYFATVAGTPDASSREAMLGVAESLGVSKSEMSTCLDSGAMTAVVSAMSSGAQGIGISSTPSTVVVSSNGDVELINGAQPQAQVEAIIEKYL